MTPKHKIRSALSLLLAIAVVAPFTQGCLGTPEMTTPEPYDYDSRAILITNTDWGVIPLPNNFLNPVKQSEFVVIPGVEAPETAPANMALPIVDETAAQIAVNLGYPVQKDSDLTRALIGGMNRLDGWVTSFAPKIPFSKEPDLESIVPFDGTNGAAANLFFLDITDPDAPEVITADKYFRVVNYEKRTEYPFYLSLRFVPPGPFQAPADFLPGHTYAIVVTGMDETTGLLANSTDGDGNPVKVPVEVENNFLVFAAPDRECPDMGECMFRTSNPVTDEEVGLTYISTLGTPVNSVLSGLDAVRQAEGARQITDYVLSIWENMDTVKDARSRQDVVAAFQWTTVSNPMPVFFDAAAALMGGNPLIPTPADYWSGDTLSKAKSGCNPSIDFRFKTTVAGDTINDGTVRLFKVSGDAVPNLTEVPITVTTSDNAGATAVQVKAASALTPDTMYLVIATNGILSADKNRTAVDETYFGLTRAALPIVNEDGAVTGFTDTPLVGDDGDGGRTWNSPNLDSRLDTLILNHCMTNGIDPIGAPITSIEQSALEDAKNGSFGVMKVLENLEALRAMYKPLFDLVVLDTDAVQSREDIVLGWTFTTGACN